MNKLCKILLLGACCFVSWAAYAGEGSGLSAHEIRVRASWNCNSAKEWCKENQSVAYNKCMCAKRMCDAAQRAGEAAKLGYDNGQECVGGDKYCSTAHSSECNKALEGPRPSEGAGSGSNSDSSSSSSSGSSSSSKASSKSNTTNVSLMGVGECKAGTNGQRTCSKKTIKLDVPNELLAESFVCEKDCPEGCSKCKDYYLCKASDSGAVSCKSHTTICSQLLLKSAQNVVLRVMGSGSSQTTELISQKLADAGCGELECTPVLTEPSEGTAGSANGGSGS